MRNRGEERHTTKSAGKRERTRYPLFPMRLNEFKYRARLITFGNKLTFSLFSPANKDKCESRTRQVREASQTRREERAPSEKHPKKDAYSTEYSPIVVVYVNGSFLTEVVPTHL